MTTFNENLEEDCQFDPNKLGDLGGDLNEVRLFGSIHLVHQKPNLNKIYISFFRQLFETIFTKRRLSSHSSQVFFSKWTRKFGFRTIRQLSGIPEIMTKIIGVL